MPITVRAQLGQLTRVSRGPVGVGRNVSWDEKEATSQTVSRPHHHYDHWRRPNTTSRALMPCLVESKMLRRPASTSFLQRPALFLLSHCTSSFPGIRQLLPAVLAARLVERPSPPSTRLQL